MFDVFFYNSNLGWISSIGSVYKTEDGRNNWIKNKRLELANFRSIYFISPDTDWVVGEDVNYKIIIQTVFMEYISQIQNWVGLSVHLDVFLRQKPVD